MCVVIKSQNVFLHMLQSNWGNSPAINRVVDDARESSLKEEKHCSSSLKYDISSGLLSALTITKSRADHKGIAGEGKIGYYRFSSLKTEHSKRLYFNFPLTTPL